MSWGCLTSLRAAVAIFLLANLGIVIIFMFIIQEDEDHQLDNSLLSMVEFFRQEADLIIYRLKRELLPPLGQLDDVTLVTHCSADKLDHLHQQLSSWNGPYSASILCLHLDYCLRALRYIDYMLNCLHRNNTGIEVYMVAWVSAVNQRGFDQLRKTARSTTCNVGDVTLSASATSYSLDRSYPTNLMRNIATYGVRTTFTLNLDVDLVPSNNVRDSFLTYINSDANIAESNLLYVLPALEINRSLSIPRTKNHLAQAWSTASVRPFYSEVCSLCQSASNISAWFNFSGEGITAFAVDWAYPYEPFFIEPSGGALFDPRFTQYGFNRVSRLCELHVAGYNFVLLSNHFVVHIGLKETDDFHHRKVEEHRRNRALYESFKESLKERYVGSSRSC